MACHNYRYFNMRKPQTKISYYIESFVEKGCHWVAMTFYVNEGSSLGCLISCAHISTQCMGLKSISELSLFKYGFIFCKYRILVKFVIYVLKCNLFISLLYGFKVHNKKCPYCKNVKTTNYGIKCFRFQGATLFW